jgi:signal transduction histidine kinase
VLKRYRPTIVIVVGFLLGLLLATLDKMFPPRTAGGPIALIAVIVDWTAPPLAGSLVAAALLVAQRYKRLHDAERAASRVLAERLTGTERRQALWVVAAAIAHDLKNPLHNLQLLMEELDEESDPVKRAELIARLRENVDRASGRVSELSRAGRAPEEVQEPVDLATALQELEKRVESAARMTGTEILVECPRGLAVRADALAVRSAVENVVANALEALQQNGPGGRLAVRARQVDGATVELTVEDNGPGIPDEVRPRLFIPFASGRESTGLGLAIARALARASGGELICTDAREGHTCFRFTFQGPARGSDQRRLPSSQTTERIDA